MIIFFRFLTTFICARLYFETLLTFRQVLSVLLVTDFAFIRPSMHFQYLTCSWWTDEVGDGMEEVDHAQRRGQVLISHQV